MKVLAFAASSSQSSINKQLATYAAHMVDNAQIDIVDLNDYELPLFSEDKEKEIGKPKLAQDFLNKVAASDAVVISFAEHNGSYTAAYKNLFDWCSRITPKVFQHKSLILLATSPGKGGASSVLNSAVTSAPYFDGVVKGSLSIPSFYDNFDLQKGKLINSALNNDLLELMAHVKG